MDVQHQKEFPATIQKDPIYDHEIHAVRKRENIKTKNIQYHSFLCLQPLQKNILSFAHFYKPIHYP